MSQGTSLWHMYFITKICMKYRILKVSLKIAMTILCLSFLQLSDVHAAGGSLACAKAHSTKLQTSKIEFPPDIREFLENFEESFRADLQVRGLELIKRDKSQTREKITTLVKLGFIQRSLMPQEKRLTWLEISENYRKLLDKKKVPEADRLYPALVLYKDSNGVREYKLIDPIREAMPKKEERYSILSTNIEFNIPFKMIAKGIQEGKFPMMASHDIYHFVSFSMHPWFTKIVKQAIASAAKGRIGSAFKRRFFWIFEFFSIPNGNSAARSLMEKYNLNTEMKTYSELRADLEKLDDKIILKYITELGQVLDKSLLDVSGVSANPAEFKFIMERFFSADDLTTHTEGSLKFTRLSLVAGTVDVYRRNASPPKKAMRDAIANEISIFNFKTISYIMRTINTALKTLNEQDLLKILKQHINPQEYSAHYLLQKSSEGNPIGLANNAREILIDHVRDLAAMTEFALLSIRNENDAQAITQSLLKHDASYEGPGGRFLNEIFQNDLIKKYYFDGLKRQEN